MWDAAKQQQLNELQRREEQGILSNEERDTLEALLYELEQQEWDTLRPALERLRAEQKQLQEEYGRVRSQNAALAALAERQEDLLKRARVQLAGLLSEHEALKSAYERVTGQSLSTRPS